MKPYVKMMLMEHGKNGENERREYDRPRMGGDYEIDGAFRDRRGRRHYDDGRYAPMPSRRGGRRPRSAMDDGDDEEMRGDYWPRRTIPPYGGGDGMNEIGFERGARAEHHGMNEMEHRWSGKEHGHAQGYEEFTHESAKEWTKKMRNEDGTTGPHWSMDQVKELMKKQNIEHDPASFWAILNSIYSDYCAVFKKHGVNTMEMYIDMTKAWLDDKDAVEDKAGAYYECVVKH